MDSFRNLGIAPEILKVITEEGFTEPSQIQAESIPLILAGKDVIGASATGSGKTLAFGAGLLPKMTPKAGVQALILTPTRELAEQVAKSLRKFARHLPLHIEPIYGGVAISPQLRAIHNAEVIVGTPGRVLDHLQRGSLSLDQIKVFVLDEADVMFDMGFIADVEKILRQTQKNRQTLLFSATMTKEVVHIAQKHMVHPAKVDAEAMVDDSLLVQSY